MQEHPQRSKSEVYRCSASKNRSWNFEIFERSTWQINDQSPDDEYLFCLFPAVLHCFRRRWSCCSSLSHHETVSRGQLLPQDCFNRFVTRSQGKTNPSGNFRVCYGNLWKSMEHHHLFAMEIHGTSLITISSPFHHHFITISSPFLYISISFLVKGMEWNEMGHGGKPRCGRPMRQVPTSDPDEAVR